MNNQNKPIFYHPFSTFVFRTPFYSFQEFQKDIEQLDKNDSYWQEFLQDPYLQEAIFLATPILYDEIHKFLSGRLTTEKEIHKLKMAILRYYTRMSTRCTPFGLFAGVSLGKLGNETKIVLSDQTQYSRYTRLDMNYLCNFAQDIGSFPEIRKYLTYYPNNSLYPLDEKLRYVEYYYKNAKRTHNIAAIDYSEYLEAILQKAEYGEKINALTGLIVDKEISLNEAKEFVNTLIDNQILVSELEPEITGKDFLFQLSGILQAIPENETLKQRVSELAAHLSEIDKGKIGTTMSKYGNVEKIVKKLGTSYESKFLFQTDMFKPINQAILDEKNIQDIQLALELLNKLTLAQTETTLSKFTKNYSERYEDAEMPLLQVLDPESGIGYEISGYTSSLLAGYLFPQQTQFSEIKWNRIQAILHKKFLDAYKTNAYYIAINEKDFDFLNANWNDLPPTLSCICEIFSSDEKDSLIFIKNCSGSSAANLLGRFCHVNEQLENYVKEITAFEQDLNPNVVYAEIVHLPESRTGNILLRPVLRSYEIPYLGKSAVSEEFQIALSDLVISVREQKILLRSKRLNKEIIPRLSTAHNYSFNSMPIYHFLCDLQIQKLRNGLFFSWGTFGKRI